MIEGRNENKEEIRPPWEEPVEEEYAFDNLARGLNSDTILRARALKLVGAAISSSALVTVWSDEAQARRRRRRHHHRY